MKFFTYKEMCQALANYAKEYIKIGHVSVVANNHTSKIGQKPKPPPPKAIHDCIITFVKFCQSVKDPWEGEFCTEKVLDTLVEFIRKFPKNNEGTRAILVDFINYIGTMNGIHYMLTTGEI
jgi:hypothetical protein